MNKIIKNIINKFICLHDYEKIGEGEIKASPDELVILQCKKCKKIKFVGGYSSHKINL